MVAGFSAGGVDVQQLDGGRSFTPPGGSDVPELGSITIRFPGLGSSSGTLGAPSGIQIDRFLSYDYHEDYLVPVDAGSFTVSGDELSDSDLKAIIPGARIEVTINGQPQSAGFLDDIRIRSSRSSGSIVTFEYRSWLSPAVDAQVDPQTRFAPSMSLGDLVQAALGPFGVTVFTETNDANRNAITGQIYGTRTSKKGKPIKSIVLHQIKPYDNEGAFAFASRVSQRFGLWIRPGVNEGEVIIAEPDFTQDPRYALHHKVDDSSIHNNVIESDVVRSRKDQPSIIFASGFGGGGEFAKATLKGMIINPLLSQANSLDSLLALNGAVIDAYKTVKPVIPSSAAIAAAIQAFQIPDVLARPLYLKDRDAHNQDELDAFLRRELSLRMRKALQAHYMIEGHTLNGQPVAVDSIISVDDDRSNVHMPLWIISRRFSKAAGSAGTTTSIECILPGTLVFGPGST